MQDDATSVPKFKTFKAKVAPGSHLHQTFSHEAANSTKGRWSRSRSPPIDDRHPWPESRNRGRGASDLSPRKLFISDPLGDEKNLIYGSLDRHAIPAYKRSGHGQILGLTQNHTYEVVKGSGTESIAVSTTRSSQKALLSLNQRPVQIPDHHQEALIRSDPVARGTEIEDFVSLIESDHEAVSRAIDADHRTKDVIDLTQSQDAHTYTQPVRGGDVKALAAIRNVSRYSLADGLPSSPAIHEGGSLHTWLQLIKDADVSGHTMSNLGTAAWLIDPKSRAEIRISICEKALQQEWTEKASDVLLICLMKEARLAWDEPKLRRKWKVLLQAGHPQLRLHYADYLKTSARTFQFYEVRQAFLDCIEDCRALASRGGTCLDKLADLNTTGLSCVLQMSQFFLEAGHTEFAISVWQSVLQFAVLNPGIACLSQRPPANDDVRRTQAFEEFWESDEALRIGEAVGEYAPSPENIGFGTPSRNSEMENGQDPSMHKFGSHNQWALSERERSLRYYLPARITEDGVTEDPFRVVLFTDIKNCLFTFDSSIVSPRDLVNGYLNFFQLPAMPIWPSEKAQDPIFNMPVTRQLCGQTMVDVARPMFLWINKVTLDQHTMFNLGDWPAALCSLDACRSSSPATTFLLRSLEALVRAGFGGDELAEYALSIELKISPDTVRGRAKMYLKRWSSSLRLYNALALIESRLGNPEKARSVLVKSLKMTVQMEPDVQIQSVIPWRTLVWELMSTGKQGEAFDQISLFGREDELIVDQRIDDRASMAAQPSASLQTEKRLRDRCGLLMQCNHFQLATIAAECLFLHAYLQTSSDLGAALVVFRGYRKHLEGQNAAANEMLHQSFAHLIHFHMKTTQIIKLVEVRDLLEELIDAFPLNTIFMSLYAWNESRIRVHDRLHSRVNKMVLRSEQKVGESIILHSFLIDLELARHQKGVVQPSTVRNAFEGALTSEICAHSASLWQRYMMFEVTQNELPRAEKVVLRAIGACPWVKEFFLLAFEHLGKPGVMEDGKLQALHALLEERGLRVHETYGR